MRSFTHTIVFGLIIVVPVCASPRTWRHNGEWAMTINGKTKALRSPPPRWVSAQLVYVWVSARRRSQWCSQNLHRPFLRAVRFDYSINYLITLRGTSFPYQECNVGYKSVIHVGPCGKVWSITLIQACWAQWERFGACLLSLCCHCGHQSDTYALKLCESCSVCFGFCGQVLSPVVSAALPTMKFLQPSYSSVLEVTTVMYELPSN